LPNNRVPHKNPPTDRLAAQKLGASPWSGVMSPVTADEKGGPRSSKKALAYVRVSSRSQDDAMQRTAIERAASVRDEAIDDWRAEKRSAKTMAREELQRLLADARTGKLRGRRLYVFRLDRLTRSGIADTLTTLAELRTSGVEVVSVADGFDLNGPHAEVIIAVMAWAAKMERLATNERIAAARDRLEVEGGHWGRPRRMTVAELDRAVALRREDLSFRVIARIVRVPCSTVARAVTEALSQKPALDDGDCAPDEPFLPAVR
jgi:DNA invertase Pin-like site-specific DNA recombinase